MKLTKTIKMRIVRPFYPPEVEEEIAKHKQRSSDGDVSGDRPFWRKLKKEHPEIVTWDELGAILNHLRLEMTRIYNRAASTIYAVMVSLRDSPERQRLALKAHGVPDEKFDKWTRDDRKIGMASLLSAIGYPEAMEATQNSVMALGIRQKLQSSFSGDNLRELRKSQRSLPTARSDRFPIPIYSQQHRETSSGGFTIREENGDFILEIPFPRFEIKDGKVSIPPSKGERKKQVALLLSTKTRRRRGTWQGSQGTDAEVRRLMTGEYRTSWIEIMRGRTIRDRHKWYVNITFDFEAAPQDLDKSIVGGIDLGLDNPVYCAVSNSLKRLRIGANDVRQLTKKQLARLRQLQRGSGHVRSGRGKVRKFRPVEELQRKYDLRRKKIIERWAKQVADFFLHERAGVVQMEKLDSLIRKNAAGESFFEVQLRLTWPLKEMIERIKFKLKEYGIEVKEIDPKHTSQVCHACGHRNEYFTFDYRTAHSMPMFKCEECGVECPADYNAAKNIAHYPKHFEQAKA